MKVQITRREIMESFHKVIEVGYCGLQFLLTYETPQYYTAGIYGWNADIYIVGGVAIVTGGRPFGNVQPDFKKVMQYNQAAEKIMHSGRIKKQTTKEKKIRQLLTAFINECDK